MKFNGFDWSIIEIILLQMAFFNHGSLINSIDFLIFPLNCQKKVANTSGNFNDS